MSEFVVGQWVEWKGSFWRVSIIEKHGMQLKKDCGAYTWVGSLNPDQPTPVEWQVGRTYKTTLEGVTATITRAGRHIVGVPSDNSVPEFTWNTATGLLTDLENTTKFPHLTPYLAEPETKSDQCPRFTIEQRDDKWAVIDNDRSAFKLYTFKRDAEYDCRAFNEMGDSHATNYLWHPILAKSEQIRREAAEALEKVEAKRGVQSDHINPPHYQQHPSGVECIQVTEHMTFCLGNVVKYLWRAGQKGDAVQDLEKAAWYLDREIKRLKAGAQ